MSRKRARTGLLASIGCLVLAAAVHASDQYLGVWPGIWEGGGVSGTLQLTLEKKGAELTGKVDVGQDTGDYSSTFSAASIDGTKFTARYPYTPEPQADIVLEGTFDGNKASGTWTMVESGGNTPFAAGSWEVEKK
jgi:hypothetical protein